MLPFYIYRKAEKIYRFEFLISPHCTHSDIFTFWILIALDLSMMTYQTENSAHIYWGRMCKLSRFQRRHSDMWKIWILNLFFVWNSQLYAYKDLYWRYTVLSFYKSTVTFDVIQNSEINHLTKKIRFMDHWFSQITLRYKLNSKFSLYWKIAPLSILSSIKIIKVSSTVFIIRKGDVMIVVGNTKQF